MDTNFGRVETRIRERLDIQSARRQHDFNGRIFPYFGELEKFKTMKEQIRKTAEEKNRFDTIF